MFILQMVKSRDNWLYIQVFLSKCMLITNKLSQQNAIAQRLEKAAMKGDSHPSTKGKSARKTGISSRTARLLCRWPIKIDKQPSNQSKRTSLSIKNQMIRKEASLKIKSSEKISKVWTKSILPNALLRILSFQQKEARLLTPQCLKSLVSGKSMTAFRLKSRTRN